MQKFATRNFLVAAAALSACGLAAAQSNVTLFGVVDTAVQRGTGSIASKTQLGNSGLTTSRLGLRGNEDLGGGMWAGFWLEAGVNSDDGQGVSANGQANNQPAGAFNAATGANAPVRSGAQGLTFNRRSTVSLGGSWGEVRLGRDFTPQYRNISDYDVTGATGVGTAVNVTNIITGVTNTRASNAISYFMPNVSGFFGQAQYYMGENSDNVANKDDGTGYAVRLGYGAGPFEVAVATSRTQYLAGDSHQSNIGGSWDVGVAKLFADYSHDRGVFNAASSMAKADGWSLSGSVPVGANEFRAGYSSYKIKYDIGGEEPEAQKLMASYIYKFSKRTAAYATVAHVKNTNGSTTALLGATTGRNENSNGYEAGLRHTF